MGSGVRLESWSKPTMSNRPGAFSILCLALGVLAAGAVVFYLATAQPNQGWGGLGLFVVVIATFIVANLLSILGAVLGLWGLARQPRRAAKIGLGGNLLLLALIWSCAGIQAWIGQRRAEEQAAERRARWTPDEHFNDVVFSWKLTQSEKLQHAQAWLARGADINHRNGNGWTCLMKASTLVPSTEELSLLLHLNAEVNLQTTAGWTALHMAAQHSNLDVVRLLLESGADPQMRTHAGETALDLARALEPRNPALIELLEKHAMPAERP